jgi:hypothetical protein
MYSILCLAVEPVPFKLPFCCLIESGNFAANVFEISIIRIGILVKAKMIEWQPIAGMPVKRRGRLIDNELLLDVYLDS